MSTCGSLGARSADFLALRTCTRSEKKRAETGNGDRESMSPWDVPPAKIGGILDDMAQCTLTHTARMYTPHVHTTHRYTPTQTHLRNMPTAHSPPGGGGSRTYMSPRTRHAAAAVPTAMGRIANAQTRRGHIRGSCGSPPRFCPGRDFWVLGI